MAIYKDNTRYVVYYNGNRYVDSLTKPKLSPKEEDFYISKVLSVSGYDAAEGKDVYGWKIYIKSYCGYTFEYNSLMTLASVETIVTYSTELDTDPHGYPITMPFHANKNGYYSSDSIVMLAHYFVPMEAIYCLSVEPNSPYLWSFTIQNNSDLKMYYYPHNSAFFALEPGEISSFDAHVLHQGDDNLETDSFMINVMPEIFSNAGQDQSINYVLRKDFTYSSPLEAVSGIPPFITIYPMVNFSV